MFDVYVFDISYTAELPTRKNGWVYNLVVRSQIWPGIHTMMVYMLSAW